MKEEKAIYESMDVTQGKLIIGMEELNEQK